MLKTARAASTEDQRGLARMAAQRCICYLRFMAVGWVQIAVVVLVFVLLFGPRLGRVGLAAGRAVGRWRRSTNAQGGNAGAWNTLVSVTKVVRQARKVTRFPF